MLYGLGILLCLTIPSITRDPYFVHIIILIMIYVSLALSLNLLMITGQVSIAHAAFMGIGAYTSALLVMRLNFPFWLALPLSGLVTAIISLFIGLLTLKMKGIFFALATFAFNEILRMIFIGWKDLFGGANGITDIPPPGPITVPGILTLNFDSKFDYFYLVACFMIITVFIIVRIFRSRIGLILRAIEEGDLLTECLGLSIMRFKIIAFVLSSFIAGVAGCLYAHYLHYICPQDFSFWVSVDVIIFTVVGGVGSILGPMITCVILTIIPEFLRFTVEYQTLIFGFVLILALLLMPQGIGGLIKHIPINLFQAAKTNK